ncbi:Protein of unknown function [Noviherbaspirillum humi]|uniref:II family cellulose-binding protein n=1 Tax=Noviherbaspirillum humi TaxID=1688639 RepID=A0A239F6H3_9BURK|nr:DUF2721 domain-containing protein [Noviherbaspirillum humi]SNS51694.1 Protein of unknown function [Noviherbaspirillum humi]
MNLTTPVLVFPAISLLLLAYTNRFVVLTQVIRHLHNQNQNNLTETVARQIANLGLRLRLIRRMQALGVLSFILAASAMFLLLLEFERTAQYLFGGSVVLLIGSLFFSLFEILISTNAIEIELKVIEAKMSRGELG